MQLWFHYWIYNWLWERSQHHARGLFLFQPAVLKASSALGGMISSLHRWQSCVKYVPGQGGTILLTFPQRWGKVLESFKSRHQNLGQTRMCRFRPFTLLVRLFHVKKITYEVYTNKFLKRWWVGIAWWKVGLEFVLTPSNLRTDLHNILIQLFPEIFELDRIGRLMSVIPTKIIGVWMLY